MAYEKHKNAPLSTAIYFRICVLHTDQQKKKLFDLT